MSPRDKFDCAFSALVAASTDDEFERCLADVFAFLKNEEFRDSGPARGAFEDIKRKISPRLFSSSAGPEAESEFVGDNRAAHTLRCIVAVLRKLADVFDWFDTGLKPKRRWGWDALDREEKVMCRVLLACKRPVNVGHTAIEDLWKAKQEVARIIADRLPPEDRLACPPLDRVILIDVVE
jgi:hypothetical protein